MILTSAGVRSALPYKASQRHSGKKVTSDPDIQTQRLGGLRMLSQMVSQRPVSAERMGLSEREATARLRREGYNELPALRRRGLLAAAVEVVREPMFVLLIGGGLVYFVLQSHLCEALTTADMGAFGVGLVTTTPSGPVQDLRRRWVAAARPARRAGGALRAR